MLVNLQATCSVGAVRCEALHIGEAAMEHHAPAEPDALDRLLPLRPARASSRVDRRHAGT